MKPSFLCACAEKTAPPGTDARDSVTDLRLYGGRLTPWPPGVGGRAGWHCAARPDPPRVAPLHKNQTSLSLQRRAPPEQLRTTANNYEQLRTTTSNCTRSTEILTTPWAGRIHPNAAGHFHGGHSAGRGPEGLSARCSFVVVATRPTLWPGPPRRPFPEARRIPGPPGPRGGCPSRRIGPWPRGGIHNPPHSPAP